MTQTENCVVNGTEYSIGRLDMFQALEVARLAAPTFPIIFSGVLQGVMHAAKNKTENGDASAMDDIAVLLVTAKPVLDCIASMPKETFQSLLRTCLSCVSRNRGKGFAPVLNQDGIPFDDFNSGDALVLAMRVIIREVRPIGAALFKSESVL